MTFVEAVNELRLLLAKPNVPAEVVNRALGLIYCPEKALYIEGGYDATLGTAPGAVLFQASDRLRNFVAAARAREWEKIIITELKHDRSASVGRASRGPHNRTFPEKS